MRFSDEASASEWAEPTQSQQGRAATPRWPRARAAIEPVQKGGRPRRRRRWLTHRNDPFRSEEAAPGQSFDTQAPPTWPAQRWPWFFIGEGRDRKVIVEGGTLRRS